MRAAAGTCFTPCGILSSHHRQAWAPCPWHRARARCPPTPPRPWHASLSPPGACLPGAGPPPTRPPSSFPAPLRLLHPATYMPPPPANAPALCSPNTQPPPTLPPAPPPCPLSRAPPLIPNPLPPLQDVPRHLLLWWHPFGRRLHVPLRLHALHGQGQQGGVPCGGWCCRHAARAPLQGVVRHGGSPTMRGCSSGMLMSNRAPSLYSLAVHGPEVSASSDFTCNYTHWASQLATTDCM